MSGSDECNPNQPSRNEFLQSLGAIYGLIAIIFTLIFEVRIAIESGFMAWLFVGSWVACILGALWPFTMFLLF
jgi:hypothetical protein